MAAEPLIESPIALTFDPEGRIWVIEMRGFMPNPDGIGETNIAGRNVFCRPCYNSPGADW